MIASIGIALVLIGALSVYLASSHQRALTGPLPAWVGLVGFAAIAAGTLTLFAWSGPATSIFIAFTFAMLVWSIVPPAVAWWRGPKEKVR